jgi:LacI family transcriptional regulator
LKDWHGDGMIFRLLTPRFVKRLRRRGIPVVNLNDKWGHGFDLPWIRSDDQAIGRLAAEHLFERGFRHFAFCGFTSHDWSRKRREGFVAALEQGGGTFHDAYESPWESAHSLAVEREQDKIGRWLQALPRPVGVLACNDLRGQHVLDACRQVNLAVPEEAAVVGVDNDALLCGLCHPPLSSVIPNAEQIGVQAAVLLDRLMAGDNAAQQGVLIAPLRVVTRQSTDVLAIDNPRIAAAERCIRERACRGITVSDVLAQVSVSRIQLERQFRRYLGHSPQAEIRAVQVKRVKQLLAETELTLERIAELAGYRHSEYMSVVFKRLTGQTPAQYRRQAIPANHSL